MSRAASLLKHSLVTCPKPKPTTVLFARITTQKTVSEEETNISDVGTTDSVKEEQGEKNEEQTSGSKE